MKRLLLALGLAASPSIVHLETQATVTVQRLSAILPEPGVITFYGKTAGAS